VVWGAGVNMLLQMSFSGPIYSSCAATQYLTRIFSPLGRGREWFRTAFGFLNFAFALRRCCRLISRCLVAVIALGISLNLAVILDCRDKPASFLC
jgi:hypothetical protein